MKTSLCINTRNPKIEWLKEAIISTQGAFDEVLVYFDEAVDVPEGLEDLPIKPRFIYDGKARPVNEGINHVVRQANGEWICAFCDDDYFLYPAVGNLIKAIKEGKYEDADVVHFKVDTSAGQWGATRDFSLDEIMQCNLIPFGSFFRKTAFDDLGGFIIEPLNDWNFWIRAKRAKKRFSYFNEPVYFFRTRSDSLTGRLDRKYGGMENISRMVRETL